ncbi:MAG: rhodanese-like domain-containing protein [Oscillospiraceae bacterium]|nr:rhodanese-like domain-containing protein [Oscillospiraceae bacterium]
MKQAIAALALLVGLTGCGAQPQEPYRRITAEEAQALMDGHTDEVVLDVREPDEYAAGHIPGAVLLPVGSIDGESAAALIPGRDTLVLVYCRSGRRSQTAAEVLAGLGYTDVAEFGGILDWPYGTEP